MRVNRFDLGRLRNEEHGAVMMIVALCLLVFLGMLVLTVDLGRMVASKRLMVNTSDSAVLAAAQQCATGNGEAAASAAADETALMNEAGAVRVIWEIDSDACDDPTQSGLHFVQAGYEQDLKMFFAPIFGVSSRSVGAEATAVWGPAGSTVSPMPIRLDLDALFPCISGEVGQACTFGYDNRPGANSFNASQWGYLWFHGGAGWNSTDCRSQAGGAAELFEYILGTGTEFDAILNDPPATYACAQPGRISDATETMRQRIGDLLVFPVMDSENYPVNLTSGNESYPIVGFTVLRLLGVYERAEAKQHCPELQSVPDQSLFCLELQWEGPQPGGTIPIDGSSGAPDLGLRAFRLVD